MNFNELLSLSFELAGSLVCSLPLEEVAAAEKERKEGGRERAGACLLACQTVAEAEKRERAF
jgi:hypothetical protein